jgi:nitrate/TMAO reductase-like tetraheme cytochrome c subunit
MKPSTCLLLIGGLLSATSVFAHRQPQPAHTPASYQAECGSCHTAFPPALLSARDWQLTMQQLADHFGSDASLNAANQREIGDFLQANAGKKKGLDGAGNPPRITKTSHFVRHHREVPTRFWRDSRVKSAANCEACHRDAEKGRFSEHDILIPELRD